MKIYVVVIEAATSRGFSATVSEKGHQLLETAKVELVETTNRIKADPIPYFGYADKKDLRVTWTTERLCEIKDSFSGNIINVYIHEINVLRLLKKKKASRL